jgi:bacterioferritin-associated ferredoxin
MCHCLGVDADEIRDAIEQHDLSSVRGVTNACGAGGGCTACHRHIKRMLQEHALQKRMASDPAALPAFGFA